MSPAFDYQEYSPEDSTRIVAVGNLLDWKPECSSMYWVAWHHPWLSVWPWLKWTTWQEVLWPGATG